MPTPPLCFPSPARLGLALLRLRLTVLVPVVHVADGVDLLPAVRP